MAVNSHANDAMIRRLENELEERNAYVQGLITNAQDSERDLNETETRSLGETRTRMGELKNQIEELEATSKIAQEIATRARQVDQAITVARKNYTDGPVEYRSTGHYLVDYLAATVNHSRQAVERIELFTRAAAHQKTSDNLGVVPDPIIGGVINFIDAARPAVTFFGPQNMESATWYRPKVTQRTLVGVQGSAGGPADEKAELVSQKMTITRIPGNAVTYGGYVNVSRQDIDFASPSMLDVVVNDLAAQYAIQTEAVLGTLIQTQANNVELATAVAPAVPTAQHLSDALWTAVGNIYAATKGVGQIALIVPPSRLGSWGSVFSPVNPQNAQSAGFNASGFGSGLMGNISGIPVYCSPGYPTVTNHYGSVVSSAAIEVYEQRVGALQVIEPSVIGVQVAYAGYFTPMVIESTGVQRIVNLA